MAKAKVSEPDTRRLGEDTRCTRCSAWDCSEEITRILQEADDEMVDIPGMRSAAPAFCLGFPLPATAGRGITAHLYYTFWREAEVNSGIHN